MTYDTLRWNIYFGEEYYYYNWWYQWHLEKLSSQDYVNETERKTSSFCERGHPTHQNPSI